MPNNYVISDLHLGHKNIIEFERTEFKTIQEHDDFIIAKWNSVVKDDDTVFVLGDVSLNIPKTEVSEKIHHLKGTKILILGNHDHGTKTYYSDVGFESSVEGPVFVYNGKVILSHEPAQEAFNSPYSMNIYGHLHGSYLDIPNYVTVSAKMIDYTPKTIDSIANEYVSKHGEFKSRDEGFTDEWYAKYVIYTAGEWKGKDPEEVRKEFRKKKYDRRMAWEEAKKNGTLGQE